MVNEGNINTNMQEKMKFESNEVVEDVQSGDGVSSEEKEALLSQRREEDQVKIENLKNEIIGKNESKEVVRKFNINDPDVINRINDLRVKSGDNPLSESQAQEFLSIIEDLKIEKRSGSPEFFMGGNVDKFFVERDGNIILGNKSSEKAKINSREMGMGY